MPHGEFAGAEPSARRPNVLFVICDQLRADHLGLYGYEVVLQITGPVATVDISDFAAITAMDFFRVDDDGGDTSCSGASLESREAGFLLGNDMGVDDLV